MDGLAVVLLFQRTDLHLCVFFIYLLWLQLKKKKKKKKSCTLTSYPSLKAALLQSTNGRVLRPLQTGCSTNKQRKIVDISTFQMIHFASKLFRLAAMPYFIFYSRNVAVLRQRDSNCIAATAVMESTSSVSSSDKELCRPSLGQNQEGSVGSSHSSRRGQSEAVSPPRTTTGVRPQGNNLRSSVYCWAQSADITVLWAYCLWEVDNVDIIVSGDAWSHDYSRTTSLQWNCLLGLIEWVCLLFQWK